MSPAANGATASAEDGAWRRTRACACAERCAGPGAGLERRPRQRPSAWGAGPGGGSGGRSRVAGVEAGGLSNAAPSQLRVRVGCDKMLSVACQLNIGFEPPNFGYSESEGDRRSSLGASRTCLASASRQPGTPRATQLPPRARGTEAEGAGRRDAGRGVPPAGAWPDSTDRSRQGTGGQPPGLCAGRGKSPLWSHATHSREGNAGPSPLFHCGRLSLGVALKVRVPDQNRVPGSETGSAFCRVLKAWRAKRGEGGHPELALWSGDPASAGPGLSSLGS